MADLLTTKAEAGADDKRASSPTTGGRGYNARAGETIAGNLARGGDGKFTAAGTASAKKPAAKPTRKPTKGRAAKPRKGPDPKVAAARAERRAQAAADKLKRDAERQQAKLDRVVTAEQKRRQQLADRETRADAQAKRRLEVEARRMKREADKKRQAAQPKGGGGGGATKPKAPADTTAADAAERATNQTKVARALGFDLGPLASLAGGATLSPAAGADLARRGLASQQSDGSYTTTASGRTLLHAAERGDERQARAMLQRGQELRATADTRAAERAKRQAARERTRKPPTGRYKSDCFIVYKDAAGRDRWVASSSTSFEDKDQEIVSREALEADVARTDALGDHGPLRFWHVPGWDIGDCDFRVVHGRTLLESGTFRKPAYAQATKDGDQVSLGFLHPANQPGPDGVFTTIYTFERSITPAGRASNPYTRLAVKEVSMLTPEKRKEFESRLGPAAVASILGEAEQTEKSADGLGVRHKGAADSPTRTAEWDGAQWVETTKADTMPPELDAKAGGDGADVAIEDDLTEEPLDEEPAGEFVGDMTPDAFVGLITTALQATFAPLIEALNIEAKMRGVVEEVKGITANYQTTKEDADAQRAQELAALNQQIASLKADQDAATAKLKELEGDQPASAQGYRASLHGPAPTIPALKDAAPQIDPAFASFFSFGQQ